jgi:hypothetical protein
MAAPHPKVWNFSSLILLFSISRYPACIALLPGSCSAAAHPDPPSRHSARVQEVIHPLPAVHHRRCQMWSPGMHCARGTVSNDRLLSHCGCASRESVRGGYRVYGIQVPAPCSRQLPHPTGCLLCRTRLHGKIQRIFPKIWCVGDFGMCSVVGERGCIIHRHHLD